jgi:uncharacterized protein (DUF608 family)
MSSRSFCGPYVGEHLDRLAFPLGGIGAGMLCLEGSGALSQLSLRHRPDLQNRPLILAALHVRTPSGSLARVLEGPVARHKPFLYRPGVPTGSGAPGSSYGLPRFRNARFSARFPGATVEISDPTVPVDVEITGWSPFVPGDEDASSLPAAVLEYRFRNRGTEAIDAVFSFHSANHLFDREAGTRGTRNVERGFALWQRGSEARPHAEASFAAFTDDPATRVDPRWFRGGWWDPLTVLWKQVSEGAMPHGEPYEEGATPHGGSLYVPLDLAPGAERTLSLRLAWYVPDSDLSYGAGAGEPYRPWYAERYDGIDTLLRDLDARLPDLRARTFAFGDALHDTTLPPEVVEAVTANLAILRSPTVLRQADGRLWAWEGCSDDEGCCAGSCTHVWNYAQALAHLFPALERSLRETELNECQDASGHCQFRAPLPIRPSAHDFHAAADGQLGGVLKVHRDWRISGEEAWLRRIWPRVETTLDYAIRTWDPAGEGLLREPHHNTYDIEFWGADGMCSSIYVAALEAAAHMAKALGQEEPRYLELARRGRAQLEEKLFDGEYFVQRVEWEGLHADPPQADPRVDYSPEALELLHSEGPKYQYGSGCLADGVIGAWLARVCGLGEVLDGEKVASHLRAVHRYNLARDLGEHANPQRASYAFGNESGLLLCTWPKGGRPTLPFVYSDEVWTGIEYQVASHLIFEGAVEEGLEIVRSARSRYDGRVRNPFDEIECGHFYARALSSWALLQALSGARYDAVDRTLHLAPRIRGDFRAFLATATGYGTVGVHDGEPFVEVRAGRIDVDQLRYEPADA